MRLQEYPQHTLAPDPHQPELDLRPQQIQAQQQASRPFVGLCPYCQQPHFTKASYEECRDTRN